MSGPKHERLPNSLTDPSPGLRGPAESALQNFLGNPNSYLAGFSGSQPSALQTQLGNTFAQLLGNPSQGQTANSLDQILGVNPGMDILGAAQPIFNRNLQTGADILRQSGPRFASNTERLVGEQNQKALQDFNLFGQNVLQAGRAQQFSNLFNIGQFANQQQSQIQQFQQPIIQQLLGTSFQAGGLTQQPTVIEKKPWWQQAIGAATAVAPLAAAPFTGGASLAAYGIPGVGGGGVAPAPSTLDMYNRGQISGQNYFGLPDVPMYR